MSERRPEGWVIDRANDSDHKKKQPTTTMAMEKTTEKILCLIKENPQITYRALAETLGLTEDGVYWSMKKLREKGLLRRIGGRKEGYWEIVEQ